MTRPFGSGGAGWNLVNEGAVGALIFVDVARVRSLGHIAPPKISKKLTFVDLNS